MTTLSDQRPFTESWGITQRDLFAFFTRLILKIYLVPMHGFKYTYSVCTLPEIQQGGKSKIKFNKHFCLETLIFYFGAISYFLEHTSTEHHLFQINKHMNILKLSVQSENITTKSTTPQRAKSIQILLQLAAHSC